MDRGKIKTLALPLGKGQGKNISNLLNKMKQTLYFTFYIVVMATTIPSEQQKIEVYICFSFFHLLNFMEIENLQEIFSATHPVHCIY